MNESKDIMLKNRFGKCESYPFESDIRISTNFLGISIN